MTTHGFSRARRKALVFIAAAATALTMWAPVPVASADTADVVASDSFDRSLSVGWGAAGKGGVWNSSTPAKVSVSSGRGRIALDRGHIVVQTISASVTDMRATASIQLDSLPATGNGMSSAIGVRSSSAGAYQATVRFGREGAVSLSVKRLRTGSPDVTLVSDKLLPTRALAGTPYTAQVEVTGTSPVKVLARAWPTSTSAPTWQVSATDSASARVTTPGGLSLGSYLSSSTSSLGVSYDDVAVQRLPDSAPPVVPPVAPAVSTSGAVPVGSAAYPVPANAVFVTASGSRSGLGTSASPFGSLAYAIERAASGSTIVMRGGVYRESTTVPFKKRLTIQSYPKEAVWLEGSSVVTGWQRAGKAWVVNDWNHIFDHRVSSTEGVDQSNFFLDPAFPMAGHPDQVWVSGVKLRQVGSVGEVVSGTFFVDEPGRRLYVGTDPTDKQVEASTLQQGLVIQGVGTVVRGIGLRRYGNTFWMGGALSAQVDNIVLENVVSTQNATTGVNGWGKKMRFDRITVTESGALGLGVNKADDFILSSSLIQANNLESFKIAPVSGGAKITTSKRVLVTESVFDQNLTMGLWFDESAYDVTVVGNRFSDNGGSGLELEWTSKAVVANNYFIRNAKAGLLIMDANNISVWNNTFSANVMYSIRLFQDKGRGSNPLVWLPVRDVSMNNNVLSYGVGGCPYLVHDTLDKDTGQGMRVTSQGNAYHRASSSSPANMVCWANGSSGLKGFKTLQDFRAATGNDLKSVLLEGTPILTGAYQLTSAALASTSSAALPIPDSVASVIGVPANTRKLGAVSPMIK